MLLKEYQKKTSRLNEEDIGTRGSFANKDNINDLHPTHDNEGAGAIELENDSVKCGVTLLCIIAVYLQMI